MISGIKTFGKRFSEKRMVWEVHVVGESPSSRQSQGDQYQKGSQSLQMQGVATGPTMDLNDFTQPARSRLKRIVSSR